MSKSEQPPKIRIAPAVRPHHANTFVEEWFRHSFETGAIWEAFAVTHLMEWPSDAGSGGQESPEEARYKDIEDEILKRMLDAVRPVIMQAFLQAATDVLDHERRRS